LKEALAEKLLAKVLGWEPPEMAKERPRLQAMASFKYDSYEQFSPGLRFVESLALWLNQFDAADRKTAYDYMKTSLVFCSAEEMDHLVETAYQDHIRPILMAKEAKDKSLNPRHVGRIASSIGFRIRQRETLFLGLSDGARIDSFRRSNHELNHEQISQTHELANDRIDDLLTKLTEHTAKIAGEGGTPSKSFCSIVLLDDFSASGSSYFAFKADGTAKGKVAKFLHVLADTKEPLHRLVSPQGIDLVILIYVATEKALEHLRTSLNKSLPQGINSISVEAVQIVPERIKMPRGDAHAFAALIEKYYDPEIFDVHMQKGQTPDGKYGYADCGLPLVLHHNTPNNSLAILWFYEKCTIRGLFPRVQRHREMS
jgi:hypothetical protein